MFPSIRISWILRWVITWPVLVVLALNLESLLTDRGLATLATDHWGWISPMLEAFYGFITSPYVTFPTVFLSGVLAYEWLTYKLYSLVKFDEKNISTLTKAHAASLFFSFNNNGFTRRSQSLSSLGRLQLMSDLLEIERLPPIPVYFFKDEEINKAFAQYLRMLSEGERELAVKFYKGVIDPILDEGQTPPPPLAIEKETPQ